MDELELKPGEGTAPEAAAVAEVITPEAEAAPPAAPPEPRPSEAFRSRIKSNYPDEEFADDEQYFAKASAQLDDLESYKNKNMEANKALMDIFDAEPAIAEVLKDMIQGLSFRAALARHFSPEDLVPAEGAPDEADYKKNLEARTKYLKDKEEYGKRKAENTELSQKAIAEFAQETNLSEEQAGEFLTKVGEALDEVYEGKITKGFLMNMFRALNYDNDIKAREEAARIAGRNEQIDVKKEDKKPAGDGMPVIASGGAAPVPPKKKPNWIDNMVQSEQKRNIL